MTGNIGTRPRHIDVAELFDRRTSSRGASGSFPIALGVWALIKTGLNTDHIFTPTEDVLGLPHTPALALAEIGFGIVLLLAAATGAFGTFLIAVLGVASVVFGVIVVSDSWSGACTDGPQPVTTRDGSSF